MLLFQTASALVFWKLGLWGNQGFWRTIIDATYPGLSVLLFVMIVIIGWSEMVFDEIPFQALFWFQICGALFRVFMEDLLKWPNHAAAKLNKFKEFKEAVEAHSSTRGYSVTEE